MNWIDRLSELCGRVSAWLFFVIAAMITWEVVARYVFLAPTSWAEEMSQFLQIWATYLAAAYVLKHRRLISIDAVTTHLGPRWRRALDLFALVVIGLFCAVAIWYGAEILLESIRMGRATSTMLGVPKWMTESAIPAGFTLLLLQTLVEGARLLARPLDDAPEAGA